MTVLSRGRTTGGASSAQLVSVTVGVCIAATLPVALLGSLAPRVRADLGTSLGLYGLTATVFLLVSGFGALFTGRWVDRFGAKRGLVLAAILSAGSAGGFAVAQGTVTLMLAMLIGGASNAIAHPAASRLIAHEVHHRRRGLAFGIKQASVPASMMLAGLAVPSITVLIDWRGTALVSVGASILATGFALVATEVREGQPSTKPPSGLRSGVRRSSASGRLWAIAGAAALGAAASAPLATFLVDSGVATGLSETLASSALAVAGFCGMSARVYLGWLIDRRGGRGALDLVVRLLVLGALGFLLLTLGGAPTFVAGAILAYAAGWSWNGLIHYAVVEEFPASPAEATGVLQSGAMLGAGLGPAMFGVIAGAQSYGAGWAVTVGLALGSATVLAAAQRRRRGLRMGAGHPGAA